MADENQKTQEETPEAPPPSAAGDRGKPREKVRPEREESAEAGAPAEAGEEKPRPRRERAAREPKPQVPLLPLAIWRNGQFETIGEAQIVPGPYERLVRPDEPQQGNIRRPIAARLQIEGQFRLPPDLLNRKTVLRIGSLLLHVYVLSTSRTGGTLGDTAGFIIVREIQDEDQVRALYQVAG